jgi:outer membrane murein-binding lipoprotein Lpp
MTMRAPLGLLLLSTVLAGCGGRTPEKDLERRSLHDIAAEADRLSDDGLRRQARAYQESIRRAQQELDALRGASDELDYRKRSGPEAKALDERKRVLGRTLAKLLERRDVYLSRMRERGLPTREFED